MKRKLLSKQGGDPLTHARLSWLEGCGVAPGITGLELKLAIKLALQYASLPKSRARFAERGYPVAWPPQARLAEELGCSRQAIGKAAKRMAGRGLMEVISGLGRTHATEYVLIGKGNQADCLLPKSKRQRSDPEKATSGPSKGNQTHREKATKLVAPFHSLRPTKQFHSHSSGSDDDFSQERRGRKHPEFERVFNMWPHPDIDHGKAQGCWINHVVTAKVDPVHVRKRARRWCRHWEATNEKRPIYLGIWLRDRMWEDAPDDTEWRALENYESRFDREASAPPVRQGDGWEYD